MRARILFFAALVAVRGAQGQTPDTTHYTIVTLKGPSGALDAWTERDGTRAFYMEFNDLGRGPAITQRMRVGADGYPRDVEIVGHDYYKAPVDERFVHDARVRAVAEREMAVSAQQLFAVLEDGPSWSKWVPLIREVDWTSPRPFAKGTTRIAQLPCP